MFTPKNRMARHLANRASAPAPADAGPAAPAPAPIPAAAAPLQSVVVQQSVRLSLCPGCNSKIEFRAYATRDGKRYVQCPRCHSRFVIDPAVSTIRAVTERARDGDQP